MFCRPNYFHQGSWWEPLEFLKGKVGGMVANPPYIPSLMVQNCNRKWLA
jgi:release factor glutamine methyltransferase